jgi:hypothetical protein
MCPTWDKLVAFNQLSFSIEGGEADCKFKSLFFKKYFKKYNCSLPGFLLSPEDTAANKKYGTFAFMEITFQEGKRQEDK